MKQTQPENFSEFLADQPSKEEIQSDDPFKLEKELLKLKDISKRMQITFNRKENKLILLDSFKCIEEYQKTSQKPDIEEKNNESRVPDGWETRMAIEKEGQDFSVRNLANILKKREETMDMKRDFKHASAIFVEVITEKNLKEEISKRIDDGLDDLEAGDNFAGLSKLKLVELIVNAYLRLSDKPVWSMIAERITIKMNTAIGFYRINLLPLALKTIEKTLGILYQALEDLERNPEENSQLSDFNPLRKHGVPVFHFEPKEEIEKGDVFPYRSVLRKEEGGNEETQRRTSLLEKLECRVLLKRLQGRVHLNACMITSEMGQHQQALIYAKKALKFIIDSFSDQVLLSLGSIEDLCVEPKKPEPSFLKRLNPMKKKLKESIWKFGNEKNKKSSTDSQLKPQEHPVSSKNKLVFLSFLEKCLEFPNKQSTQVNGTSRNSKNNSANRAGPAESFQNSRRAMNSNSASGGKSFLERQVAPGSNLRRNPSPKLNWRQPSHSSGLLSDFFGPEWHSSLFLVPKEGISEEEKQHLDYFMILYPVLKKLAEILDDLSKEFHVDMRINLAKMVFQSLSFEESPIDYSLFLKQAEKGHPLLEESLLETLQLRTIQLEEFKMTVSFDLEEVLSFREAKQKTPRPDFQMGKTRARREGFKGIMADQIKELEKKQKIKEKIQRKKVLAEGIRPDSFIETICYLTAAFYAISTENRFQEEGQDPIMAGFDETKILESEIYLGRSVEMAYLFLPHEIPFVLQIFNAYNDLQAVHTQVIEEDPVLMEQVKFVRPLKGGSDSKLIIPLLRRPPKETYESKMIFEDFEETVQPKSMEKESVIKRLKYSTSAHSEKKKRNSSLPPINHKPLTLSMKEEAPNRASQCSAWRSTFQESPAKRQEDKPGDVNRDGSSVDGNGSFLGENGNFQKEKPTFKEEEGGVGLFSKIQRGKEPIQLKTQNDESQLSQIPGKSQKRKERAKSQESSFKLKENIIFFPSLNPHKKNKKKDRSRNEETEESPEKKRDSSLKPFGAAGGFKKVQRNKRAEENHQSRETNYKAEPKETPMMRELERISKEKLALMSKGKIRKEAQMLEEAEQ